jgi:hypothetical protein
LLRLKGRSREEVAAGLKGYQYQDGTLKP